MIALSPTAEGVTQLGERLRCGVEAMPVLWEGKKLKITISVSVCFLASVRDTSKATARIIKAADEQLFRTKYEGRNRVCSPYQAAVPV